MESPIESTRIIQSILATPQAEGFVAFESGTMIAYLLGYQLTDNQIWGRSGFIPLFGSICDSNTDPSIMGLLYAEIGRLWIQNRVLSHYVFVPASNFQMTQYWVSQSFGIEQIHAITDLTQRTATQIAPPAGIVIRKVTKEDSDQLARLSDLIWRVQVDAPVWAPITEETAAEMRESWRMLPEEENVSIFGAFYDRELVGVQFYSPIETTDRKIYLPDNCLSLVVAGTVAKARGLGINSALTEFGFSYALSNGYEYCEIDWRSTNGMASSFWPHRGFAPFAYRLVRRLDRRIVDSID
jgi:GNAT superfamily N-acetyltransferase